MDHRLQVILVYPKRFCVSCNNTVTVEGSKYLERSGLESFLLLGADTTSEMTAGKETETPVQADVQMLLVPDNKEKTWRKLQLNRNPIGEIPLLNMQDNLIKTFFGQLLLSLLTATATKRVVRIPFVLFPIFCTTSVSMGMPQSIQIVLSCWRML